MFGDGCIFRHEKSKKCRQAFNCTRHLCQFTHSKSWSFKREEQNLPEVRSLSARVITEEDQNLNRLTNQFGGEDEPKEAHKSVISPESNLDIEITPSENIKDPLFGRAEELREWEASHMSHMRFLDD